MVRKMPKVFVLEIGRPIRDAVLEQFSKIDDYISIPRSVSPVEVPEIVAEAYKKIMKLGKDGEEVIVILSGMLAIAFQLGQAIGLSHVKVIPYQFMQGRYVKIPPLTREHLFK